MSKGLEVLVKDICYKVNGLHHKSINAYEILNTKEAKYIEKSLKENKALKSQVAGLENAYDRLADKYERLYKVLEIIKRKDVNILILKYAFIHSEGINYYNKHFGNKDLHLTQEEYDLLKEVLL